MRRKISNCFSMVNGDRQFDEPVYSYKLRHRPRQHQVSKRFFDAQLPRRYCTYKDACSFLNVERPCWSSWSKLSRKISLAGRRPCYHHSSENLLKEIVMGELLQPWHLMVLLLSCLPF